MMPRWKECGPNDPSFNIERHLIVFLQENAFYAEISRHMRKVPTVDMPTAAVSFDIINDELQLWYNPTFFESLSNWEVRGVLRHEFDHITFGHLNTRRKSPPRQWNIATDLAINSLIVAEGGSRKEDDRLDARPLPKCALIPGVRPAPIDPEKRAKATKEQLAAVDELADLIEKFPKEQASEYYFNALQELSEKQKQRQKGKCKGKKGEPGDDGEPSEGGDEDGNEDFVFGPMDDHDSWDDIPDEMREYIEGKVKSIVEKAVAAADGQSDGWGHIPAHIQAEIRRSVSSVVNWRSVLRQFVGSMMRGERSTSIKRINRRYPYVHPGVKRGYTARLLVAIDQSGSVDDSQMEMFTSELGSLTKRVTVDILPFDCSADVKEVFEWRKGTKFPLKRTRMGGTDFNAPTEIVNAPENRGRWDGYLIMTDGECCAPGFSRVKRGWVLSKGHKLGFTSEETQVFLEEGRPMTGAWRLGAHSARDTHHHHRSIHSRQPRLSERCPVPVRRAGAGGGVRWVHVVSVCHCVQRAERSTRFLRLDPRWNSHRRGCSFPELF